MANKGKKMTIGEIIDNLMETPTPVIKEIQKLVGECQKVNEDLKIELKKKQSRIDYLEGQLAVYEKFLSLEDLKNE